MHYGMSSGLGPSAASCEARKGPGMISSGDGMGCGAGAFVSKAMDGDLMGVIGGGDN